MGLSVIKIIVAVKVVTLTAICQAAQRFVSATSALAMTTNPLTVVVTTNC